jgi:hypothetical protein
MNTVTGELVCASFRQINIRLFDWKAVLISPRFNDRNGCVSPSRAGRRVVGASGLALAAGVLAGALIGGAGTPAAAHQASTGGLA